MPRSTLLLLAAVLASGCGDSTSSTYGAKPADGGTYTAQNETAETNANGLSESDIVGTWDLASFVTADEVAELSDDPLPPGVEVDLTVRGTSTYHDADTYTTDAEIVMRVREAGEEIPLTFHVRQTGTWRIVGDVLSETVSSGQVTALDDVTQSVLDSAPEFADMITPMQGTTTSTRIHSVTGTAIDAQDLDSGLRFTLRREG